MAVILIVEADASVRRVLSAQLGDDGHDVLEAEDAAGARGQLQAHTIDLIIAELQLPDAPGVSLVATPCAVVPPLLVTTHDRSPQVAMGALRAGAVDCIAKPFERAALRLLVRRALAERPGAPAVELGRPRGPGPAIVGSSSAMLALQAVLERVADTPSSVLISGEIGTGKALVAEALHARSSRAFRPLLHLCCGALSAPQQQQALFGLERAAAAGGALPGKLERAAGGTLFIHDICDLTPGSQMELLRYLQHGTLERVGGTQALSPDVRIVAATSRCAAALVRTGQLLPDLFYALSVVPIDLPPLRERTLDLPALAQHFVAKHNSRLGTRVRGLTDAALGALAAHPFPGNICELENLIERGLIFCDGEALDVADFPAAVAAAALATAAQQEAAASAHGGRAPSRSGSLRERVREATAHLERELIAQALAATGGNVTHAANQLEISRKGLQNKMKAFGLRNAEGV